MGAGRMHIPVSDAVRTVSYTDEGTPLAPQDYGYYIEDDEDATNRCHPERSAQRREVKGPAGPFRHSYGEIAIHISGKISPEYVSLPGDTARPVYPALPQVALCKRAWTPYLLHKPVSHSLI
jgi:hypothetical protein